MIDYTIQFSLTGEARKRTYLVRDISRIDALCQALDLLECDMPHGIERDLIILVQSGAAARATITEAIEHIFVDRRSSPREPIQEAA